MTPLGEWRFLYLYTSCLTRLFSSLSVTQYLKYGRFCMVYLLQSMCSTPSLGLFLRPSFHQTSHISINFMMIMMLMTTMMVTVMKKKKQKIMCWVFILHVLSFHLHFVPTEGTKECYADELSLDSNRLLFGFRTSHTSGVPHVFSTTNSLNFAKQNGLVRAKFPQFG